MRQKSKEMTGEPSNGPRLLGRLRFHKSFWGCLAALSAAFGFASISQPSFYELRTVAISLPIIWFSSVLIRATAQQLALGEFSREANWVVGPTGNFSLGYETQSRGQTLAYAVSGQLAGLALMAIGWGTVGLTDLSQNAAVGIVDFRGGWTLYALATQLFWVNAFLIVLHLMPTVPFDMRALLWGMLSGRSSGTTLEPRILGQLNAALTHLAAATFAAGCVLLWVAVGLGVDNPWYAFWGGGIYLFVAARWEASRGLEAERTYAPQFRPISRSDKGSREPGAIHLGGSRIANSAESIREKSESEDEPDWIESLFDAATESVPKPVVESRRVVSDLEIDEILRKLHREGRAALLPAEQEALMLASQRFSERRTASE